MGIQIGISNLIGKSNGKQVELEDGYFLVDNGTNKFVSSDGKTLLVIVPKTN